MLICNHFPRGDYCKLVELTLLFLCFTSPFGIKFRAPGAMHHARKPRDRQRNLRIFSSRVDVHLIQALLAAITPNGYLSWLKNLTEYMSIN